MRATRSRTLAARQLIGKEVQIYTKRLCVEYGSYEEPDNCRYYEIDRKDYSTGWKIASAVIWQHDTQWYLDLEGTFNGQHYYIQVCDRHVVGYLPPFPAGILIMRDYFEYGYNHMFNCDIITEQQLENHLEKLHHDEVEEEEDYYHGMYGDDAEWDQLALSNQRQKDILERQEKAFQAAGKPANMEWREWWYGVSQGIAGGSGAGTFQKGKLS